MKIEEEIKTAMRNKDAQKLMVLRALKTEMGNASLRKGNIDSPLTEIEVISIIRKAVKQREDSIEQYTKGSRLDLVEKEAMEMVILEAYLPQPMTDTEIETLVTQAIGESEATTKKDMGKAMKIANELADGRVDGKILSKMIGERLQ